MNSCDENGLSTDPVHIDASSSLEVIEVNVAKLGDEVDHVILGAHLQLEERLGGMEGGSKRARERNVRTRE